MAKLKEIDRRPQRLFKPGDIVIAHPKRTDLITTGQGIVLKELPMPTDHERFYENNANLNTSLQYILVYFAPRDVDLYRAARDFAQSFMENPGYVPEGMQIWNSDLQLVRAETGWLDAPSIEEIQMKRFSDVVNDI